MSSVPTGATTSAALAVAEAIKASGAIIRVEPEEFNKILARAEKPLVVTASGGFIKSSYQYLTGYRGFVFFTKSPTPLPLGGEIETVSAKSIWIPT